MNPSSLAPVDILDRLFRAVFDRLCPFSLAEVHDRFAFDLQLPVAVTDLEDRRETWAIAANSRTFLTQAHAEARDDTTGWMRPKRPLASLSDLLDAWSEINALTTERAMDSVSVHQSDPTYSSENVFHSANCAHVKNALFCDSVGHSEFILASARSTHANFCIRTDDSANCSNSFSVIYSNKITSSLFIQDCFDLTDCLFCAHLAGKRHCIANMQFTEAEYRAIRAAVIDWLLAP